MIHRLLNLLSGGLLILKVFSSENKKVTEEKHFTLQFSYEHNTAKSSEITGNWPYCYVT